MKYFELILSEAENIDNVLFRVFFIRYFIRSYIKLNNCFDW